MNQGDKDIRPGKSPEPPPPARKGEAFDELIGADAAFRKALGNAERAAQSDISVLIIGESGTGKEILRAPFIRRVTARTSRWWMSIAPPFPIL